MCVPSCFTPIRLFATPWTVAHQAPLSMGFSRQECWKGLPRPPPGDLPDPGVEPASLLSPPSAGRFLATASPGTSKSTTALGQITLLSQHTRSYAQVTRSIFVGICIWGSDGPVRIVWLLVPRSLPRLPHLSRPALRSNGFCLWSRWFLR